MTANVNSGSNYVITNVKSGTAMDLSAANNKTGENFQSLNDYVVLNILMLNYSQLLAGLSMVAPIKW